MFRLAAHDNQQPGNHFLEIPTGETKGEKVLRGAIGAPSQPSVILDGRTDIVMCRCRIASSSSLISLKGRGDSYRREELKSLGLWPVDVEAT